MNMINEDGARERSATRAAYLTLRDKILTGELRAGEKLKIEKLRAMLDLGASPIREALSLLTSDMLVERIDQRGFRAASASQANFEEILQLRAMLEDRALRQSIANATSAWEEALVLSHHRMKKSTREGTAAFELAHKAFHMALLDNCSSPMLLKYCGQLYDLNIRYRYLAAHSDQYQSRDIPSEHAEILEAALAHDADLAVDRLLNHYTLTGDYLSPRLGNL